MSKDTPEHIHVDGPKVIVNCLQLFSKQLINKDLCVKSPAVECLPTAVLLPIKKITRSIPLVFATSLREQFLDTTIASGRGHTAPTFLLVSCWTTNGTHVKEKQWKLLNIVVTCQHWACAHGHTIPLSHRHRVCWYVGRKTNTCLVVLSTWKLCTHASRGACTLALATLYTCVCISLFVPWPLPHTQHTIVIYSNGSCPLPCFWFCCNVYHHPHSTSFVYKEGSAFVERITSVVCLVEEWSLMGL